MHQYKSNQDDIKIKNHNPKINGKTNMNVYAKRKAKN